MDHCHSLAIIGSGPSSIYLLKHLLDGVEHFRRRLKVIEIFEQRRNIGMGMPYNPETTERFNMSNISSEELPELTISLADWLRGLDEKRLADFDLTPDDISESEVYSRLTLGEYLHSQYHAIIGALATAGIAVREHANCKIVDVKEEQDGVTLVDERGKAQSFGRVVVATGHHWPEEDHPESGYYASPWPISKLIPAEGKTYNFSIGTLGASLSAFDVIASLAHRHGTFAKKNGRLSFLPHPGTEKFHLTMHSADGWLPHLQYAQAEPIREIERHVSREELLSLRDNEGFLRLTTYFDQVGRRVLIDAFQKDEMPELVNLLKDPDFGLEDFVEKMTEEHDYADAFEGMRSEFGEAQDSVARDRPIHWKEALDDLLYTLSYHAELMPAEDHQTLRSTVMPFVMNVIAALPLPSARMLLALREAGKLEIIPGLAKVEDPTDEATSTKVTVEHEGKTSEITYGMFVDCSGQKPLELEEYPFPSLVADGKVREALAKFKDPKIAESLSTDEDEKVLEKGGQWFRTIGGVQIDRRYRLIGQDGRASERVHDIAFPHTSGVRPYSYGLQACNDTARLLVAGWREE